MAKFSTLTQPEIKSAACSGMNCLGICYEESWNEVQSILEKLHRLAGRPKRNLQTLTECFKEAKNRAFSLIDYLLRHSLLFYVNPYSKREWMTILAAWKTLQDLVDQFEQVVVKEKGKLLEAWIWSQIQSLTKKLDALWLRNRKGSQKRKDCCHEPKKDDPSNANSVAVKRKLDLSSAGECDIKEKHKVKRKRLPEEN